MEVIQFPNSLLDDRYKMCPCCVCDGTMNQLNEEFEFFANDDNEIILSNGNIK